MFISGLSAVLAVSSVIWIIIFLRRGLTKYVVFAMVPAMASVLLGNYAFDQTTTEGLGLDILMICMLALFFSIIPFAALKLESRSS